MTPQKQLDTFIAKYTPQLAKSAKVMLEKMRRRLPKAVEMVYDNWNGLVIGFSPTERPSDAILSLLLLPDHVTLCFLQGAKLRDPKKILLGSGNQVRHVRLLGPDHLDAPEIKELIANAIDQSPAPIDGPHRLIIKSISAKQRPRRRAQARRHTK